MLSRVLLGYTLFGANVSGVRKDFLMTRRRSSVGQSRGIIILVS